jgi:hypothetical protein
MNLQTGDILCHTRRLHKATDMLTFFTLIDVLVPRRFEVHVLLDSLSTHKAAEPVPTSLARTPTSLSWMNLPEGRSPHSTEWQLLRALCHSVYDPATTTEIRSARSNDDLRSFVWKKPADENVSKAKRGCSTLASVRSRLTTSQDQI